MKTTKASNDLEIKVYFLDTIYIGSLFLGDDLSDLVSETFEKKLKHEYARYHEVDESEVTEDDIHDDYDSFYFEATYDGVVKEGLTLSELEEVFDSKVFDDDYTTTAFEFLVDEIGYDVLEALARAEDVRWIDGTVGDYAEELISDIYDIPSNLSYYFDYEAFGRDMEREGSILTYGDIVITNADEF